MGGCNKYSGGNTKKVYGGEHCNKQNGGYKHGSCGSKKRGGGEHCMCSNKKKGGNKHYKMGGKKTRSKRKGGEGHDDGPRHAIGDLKDDPAFKLIIDKEELKEEMKNYPNRFRDPDYKKDLRAKVARDILEDDSDDEGQEVGGGKKTKSKRKRKTKGKKARKTRRKF